MPKKRVTSTTLDILRESNNVLMCQYRNNALLIYNQYIGERRSNKTTFTKSLPYTFNTYSGEFTQCAKKNISKAIEVIALLNPPTTKVHPISKRKFKHTLSFITLTIPDNTLYHPSELYEILLRPFLQYLSKTLKNKYYIWKLEYQDRGQVHYHITVDIVAHWKLIRSKWNYLLKKHNLMSEYICEYQSEDPNSIDIHKVYKIKSIVSYMQKEFVKSVQNKSPYNSYTPLIAAGKKFKVWDCSDNIKSSGLFKFELESKQTDWIELLILEENNLAYTKYYDNCKVILPIGIATKDLLTDNNKQSLSNYINFVRGEHNLI